MREITAIALDFTTHCNMSCPDCCCAIPMKSKKEKTFYEWDYFVDAAKYFYGINRIHISGGEPSIHPKFTTFVPLLKDLFGCKLLTVETNATMFKKIPDTFSHFDTIYVSHYTHNTFNGCLDNTEEIEFLKTYLKNTQIIVGEVNHTNRNTKGEKMCHRGESELVGYSDGKIYPCCVGSGLDIKINILPTKNWKEEIININPPCKNCFFAL